MDTGYLAHSGLPCFVFFCAYLFPTYYCTKTLPKTTYATIQKQHDSRSLPATGIRDLRHMLAVLCSLGKKTTLLGVRKQCGLG